MTRLFRSNSWSLVGDLPEALDPDLEPDAFALGPRIPRTPLRELVERMTVAKIRVWGAGSFGSS
jgi:hypothetical protein